MAIGPAVIGCQPDRPRPSSKAGHKDWADVEGRPSQSITCQ